jgi:hypothetical protein
MPDHPLFSIELRFNVIIYLMIQTIQPYFIFIFQVYPNVFGTVALHPLLISLLVITSM